MRGRDGRRAERRKEGKQENGEGMKKGRVNEEKESWKKEGDEGGRVKHGQRRVENWIRKKGGERHEEEG